MTFFFFVPFEVEWTPTSVAFIIVNVFCSFSGKGQAACLGLTAFTQYFVKLIYRKTSKELQKDIH